MAWGKVTVGRQVRRIAVSALSFAYNMIFVQADFDFIGINFLFICKHPSACSAVELK
jgi:hypothetical protein